MSKALKNMATALIACGLLPLAATPAFAEDVQQAPKEHYSVSTTLVGTLLDDPEAAAIIKQLAPTVYDNEMFHTMGRPQTLKAIQQYEPTALSDENLAKIQVAFDELAAKH